MEGNLIFLTNLISEKSLLHYAGHSPSIKKNNEISFHGHL